MESEPSGRLKTQHLSSSVRLCKSRGPRFLLYHDLVLEARADTGTDVAGDGRLSPGVRADRRHQKEHRYESVGFQTFPWFVPEPRLGSLTPHGQCMRHASEHVRG
jgi:hypothetical protein